MVIRMIRVTHGLRNLRRYALDSSRTKYKSESLGPVLFEGGQLRPGEMMAVVVTMVMVRTLMLALEIRHSIRKKNIEKIYQSIIEYTY